MDISALRGIYAGKRAVIVGKGPSLKALERKHLRGGFVIALNDAILAVQKLRTHKVYALRKDGCSLESPAFCDYCDGSATVGPAIGIVYPDPAVSVLVQERQSWGDVKCLHKATDRYVFSTDAFGLRPTEMAVVCAVTLALYMGASAFRMVAFDAVVFGDSRVLWHDRDGEQHVLMYNGSGNYIAVKDDLMAALGGTPCEFVTPGGGRRGRHADNS